MQIPSNKDEIALHTHIKHVKNRLPSGSFNMVKKVGCESKAAAWHLYADFFADLFALKSFEVYILYINPSYVAFRT